MDYFELQRISSDRNRINEIRRNNADNVRIVEFCDALRHEIDEVLHQKTGIPSFVQLFDRDASTDVEKLLADMLDTERSGRAFQSRSIEESRQCIMEDARALLSAACDLLEKQSEGKLQAKWRYGRNATVRIVAVE